MNIKCDQLPFQVLAACVSLSVAQGFYGLQTHPNGAVTPIDEPAVAAARADHLASKGYLAGYGAGYGYEAGYGLGYAGYGGYYGGYGSYSASAGVNIAGHAPAALPAVAGAYAGAGRYCANSAGTIHCA